MPATRDFERAALPALVLVIDDALEIHDLVEVRLRQGDMPVELLHATDADTGLALARERAPDVILLDLDIPGQSGLELCRAMRRDPHLQSATIIFLTGTVDVATKVQAFEAGASDYVTKPFDAVELRARVRAALRARRYRVHLERAARQRETLLRLSAAVETTWDEQLRVLLREDSITLDVERVSYWRLSEAGAAIECEALFQRSPDRFDSGPVLRAADYPRYFAALAKATPIIAADANHHVDTAEFSTSYLMPSGIGAMMDVPVFARGELVGVVCHEHVGGVRDWAIDEQQFAVSLGHMVAHAIESEERRRAEAALRESEARFRAIAQVSPVPLVVNSLAGNCLWGNAALGKLSGLSEADMIGRKAPDFYVDASERERMISELRDHGFIDRREVQLRRASGEVYWAMVSGRPMVFDDEPAVIIGLVDLTDHKRMEDALRHTARHDALTGLPNRLLLFDLLRRELGVAARNASYRFAVLYIDLDGFKPINDQFGHDIGDQLLVSIAKRLRDGLRPMDTAARMGGDEFVAVLADVGDSAEVGGIVARLERAISAPHDLGGRAYSVGVSIGVTIADDRYRDASTLLRAADEAMYRRKREHAATRS